MGAEEVSAPHRVEAFNSPVDSGLRCLAILNAVHPAALSLQRLTVLDYLLVHSDDIPGGPPGLHPRTPHRSGELLVRRHVLRTGLMLYQSRGLVEQRFEGSGLYFGATDRSGAFLDALQAKYARGLRLRADWLAEEFGLFSDKDLDSLVKQHVGSWGAEFEWSSLLWAESDEQ